MKLNTFMTLFLMSSELFALEVKDLYNCMDSLSNTIGSPVVNQVDPNRDLLNPQKIFPVKNRSITMPNDKGEFVMVTVTENNLYTCRAKKSDKEMIFNLGKKDSAFATAETPGIANEQTYIGISINKNGTDESISYGVAQKSKEDVFSFRKCAFDRGLDTLCKIQLKPTSINNCSFTDKLNEEENSGLLEILGNKLAQKMKEGGPVYIKPSFAVDVTQTINVEAIHHCSQIPTVRKLMFAQTSTAAVKGFEDAYQKAFVTQSSPQNARKSSSKGDRKK